MENRIDLAGFRFFVYDAVEEHDSMIDLGTRRGWHTSLTKSEWNELVDFVGSETDSEALTSRTAIIGGIKFNRYEGVESINFDCGFGDSAITLKEWQLLTQFVAACA